MVLPNMSVALILVLSRNGNTFRRIREAIMRVTLAFALAAAAMLLNPPAANAVYQGPWCSVETGRGSGYYNCRMRTFEECRLEVVAGNRGFCTQNPNWPGWYGQAVGDVPKPVRKRRAR
jgi:hypothetical protein